MSRLIVLDACQQVLKQHTDIKFTYEPTGKKGKCGKILFLKFAIQKNKDYIDQQPIIDNSDNTNSLLEQRLNFMSSACNIEPHYKVLGKLDNMALLSS